MWNTPDGIKKLEQPLAGLWAFGASWLLDYYFDTVVSDLGDPDEIVFESILDHLTPNTIGDLFLRVSTSLLSDDPAPDQGAYDEALIYAVWSHLICQVDASMGRDRYAPVMKAMRAATKIINNELVEDDCDPYSLRSNDDITELLEMIADSVLWDRDFDMDFLTDMAPEGLKIAEERLGIRPGYFDLPPESKRDIRVSMELLGKLLEPFTAPFMPKKRKRK